MKKVFFLAALRSLVTLLPAVAGFLLTVTRPVIAQPAAGADLVYQTQTDWPGVNLQIAEIDRIMKGRLVALVRIQATEKALKGGTFLGTIVPIPAGISLATQGGRDAILSGRFAPKPYSLAGSTMTDELTNIRYPMLSPIAPPHEAYPPSITITTLHPGQQELLTIQFAAPPPPPLPAPGQPPVKQTLSFLLPKAKGPIVHVPLPPPVEAKTP
jgi:hypothetical protein